MMPFLCKKKSTSSTLSMSSASTAASASSLKSCLNKSFAKFDEKKDYVRRCNKKHPAAQKSTPCLVSFCVGKKF